MYYHNMLLTTQLLPVMCEICCEFFIFQRNNVSAQTSELGDAHIYFIRVMAQAPRSERSELQNLHGNLAAGLPQKNSQRERTDIMVWQLWLA